MRCILWFCVIFLASCSGSSSVDQANYIDSILVRTAGLNEEVHQPDNYQNSILQGQAFLLKNDTIVLNKLKAGYLEIEVFGKTTFDDINVKSSKQDYRKGKPWINRKDESYFLSQGRALWIMRPGVYSENFSIDLSYPEGNKTIYVKNLDVEAYQELVFSKNTPKQRREMESILKNIKADLETFWHYTSMGSGRRKYNVNTFDIDRFFRKWGRFEKGIYSNEYTKTINNYKVTVGIGNNSYAYIE